MKKAFVIAIPAAILAIGLAVFLGPGASTPKTAGPSKSPIKVKAAPPVRSGAEITEEPTTVTDTNTDATATSTSPETSEIVLEVPTGALVPAAFLDDAANTPQQHKVLDRIAAEFKKNISTREPGVSEAENWEAARKIADQRYLTFFGYQSYNQHHLQGAKEALKERKSAASAARTP